jgi:hypothetical protein
MTQHDQHNLRPWEAATASGAMTPATVAACEVDSTDVAIVQRALPTPGTPHVGPVIFAVGSTTDDEVRSAFLTPANARRIAAALLNAADEADGTTPLVFMPRLPDEPKPRP